MVLRRPWADQRAAPFAALLCHDRRCPRPCDSFCQRGADSFNGTDGFADLNSESVYLVATL